MYIISSYDYHRVRQSTDFCPCRCSTCSGLRFRYVIPSFDLFSPRQATAKATRQVSIRNILIARNDQKALKICINLIQYVNYLETNGKQKGSLQEVLKVSILGLVVFLHLNERQEVLRPMALNVKPFWCIHLQRIIHPHTMLYALKVVIPS